MPVTPPDSSGPPRACAWRSRPSHARLWIVLLVILAADLGSKYVMFGWLVPPVARSEPADASAWTRYEIPVPADEEDRGLLIVVKLEYRERAGLATLLETQYRVRVNASAGGRVDFEVMWDTGIEQLAHAERSEAGIRRLHAVATARFAGTVPRERVEERVEQLLTRPVAVTVVPGFLEFRLQYNEGAALGILQGYRWLFVVIGVLATAVLLFWFARTSPQRWFCHVGMAMLLGGALGNIYDRVVLGRVRDFVHITTQLKDIIPALGERGIWPWIWNIADSALMIGVGMILLSFYHAERLRAKRGGPDRAGGRSRRRPR